MKTIVLALAAVATLLGSCVLANPTGVKKAVSVKGALLCGSTPFEGAKVRLFRGRQLKADNLTQILDERLSSPSGLFHLDGNTDGFALEEQDIDPHLTIYHWCDEDGEKVAKNGYRKFTHRIPASYVSAGGRAKKTYDLGKINLQVIFPEESHDKKYQERDAAPSA